MNSAFTHSLDHHAGVPKRLSGLKFRFFLTIVVIVLCGFFGVRLMAAPLAKLGAWIYALSMQQTALPLAHVPPIAAIGLAAWLPQAIFLLVGALAIVGFSIGIFGRTRFWIVMVAPLLIGVATFFFIPPTSQWMHLLPSQLERDIVHVRPEAAERVLKQADANAALVQYVQAQIALRGNDRAALQKYGEAVLTLADRWSYGLAVPDDAAALSATVQFRPEVIHALDVALNGEPQTQVGIQWQQAYSSSGKQLLWAGTIAQAAFGIALLIAALRLIDVSSGMRRRIHAIQAEIENVLEATEMEAQKQQQAQQSVPASFVQQPAVAATAAESESGPSLVALEAPKPRHALDTDAVAAAFIKSSPAYGDKVKAGTSSVNRIARGLAIAILVFAGAHYWFKPRLIPVQMAVPEQGGDAKHPCAYIGEWTSARENSVYKITMKDNGEFIAEPLARGQYADATIEGEWFVRGQYIEWTEKNVKRSTKDINLIRNFTGTSFTLDEVNGSVTRFNLIHAFKSTTCDP